MVFDILLENKERHLTADEILRSSEKAEKASVKQRSTAILKIVRLGRGAKIHGRRRRQRVLSIRRQNAECREHYHLKCTECGKLIHAECKFLSELSAHIYNEHGFKVDGSRTVLYGVCGDCLKRKGSFIDDNSFRRNQGHSY